MKNVDLKLELTSYFGNAGGADDKMVDEESKCYGMNFFPLVFGRRGLNTFNYPQLSKFRRNQNWTWRSWFKSLMFGVWSLDRRDKETHSFEMESFILHCFQISLIILFLRNFLIQFQHGVSYDCDAVTNLDHVTTKSKSESSSG